MEGARDLPCREHAHGGRYRVDVRAARGIDEFVRRLELGHERHAVRSAHADRRVPSALLKEKAKMLMPLKFSLVLSPH